MSNYAPYPLPKASKISASINNVLCKSAYPWPIQLGSKSFLMHPVFLPLNPIYDSIIELQVGEVLCYVALQENSWCFLHNVFENKDNLQDLSLPAELEQALLENLTAPIINSLSSMLDINIDIKNSYVQLNTKEHTFSYSDLQKSHERVSFALSVQDVPNNIAFAKKDFWADVWLPHNFNIGNTVHKLMQILPHEYKESTVLLEDVPLFLGIEVGKINLSQQKLLELECGDILLPDTLYIQNNTEQEAYDVRLILYSNNQIENRTRIFTRGSIQNNSVQVLEDWHMSEQEKDSVEIIDEENSQDVLENLDVLISFELDRRSISLQEAKAITTGHTFALDCDKNFPVTLRINGKNIGSGRLVDMEGLLGVEVVKLG